MGVAEVNCFGGFKLHLNAVESRAHSNTDFSDGIAEIGPFPQMSFDKRCRSGFFNLDHIARGNGAGIRIR